MIDAIAPESAVVVRDRAGFSILVDAGADDPISQSLRAPVRWFKRWRRPSCAPHLSLLRSMVRPGDRVLDLGAHIGTFALAAGALGCEVLAVEPAPRNAELLRASVARNGFSNIRVVQAVVSDRAGTVAFCPSGPFGHVFTPATGMPSINVPAVRVDDLLAEVGWDKVHFIKMDVEGSEVPALDGMAALLSHPAGPPILYESNAHTLAFYGHTPLDLRRRLDRFGYQSYRQADREWMVLGSDEPQGQLVVDCLALKGRVRPTC